jgi:mannose-6-phosphate isomerase-like protein (cupin superfamily)
MGNTNEIEAAEVERMASIYPEIQKEINEISAALAQYAEAGTAAPHPAVKPFLMAVIDYTERLMNGEAVAQPPVLHTDSKIEDFKSWLERPDMSAPADFDELYAKIIGFTPQVTSAIVWIKNMAPHEVHDDEYEKFLVLEGTCDITIGEQVHQLTAGDYLSIPLHIGHTVRVTSACPCKVILQRIAA